VHRKSGHDQRPGTHPKAYSPSPSPETGAASWGRYGSETEALVEPLASLRRGGVAVVEHVEDHAGDADLFGGGNDSLL